MKYDLEWLKAEYQLDSSEKFLFFWGHRPNRSGEVTGACLSQWWHAPFSVEGIEYKTAEHWMMAQKALLFGANDVFQRIITCKTPGEAKVLGRLVENFDEAIWLKARYEIVLEGNLQKFSQHQELSAFLIGTNRRVLVEASPVDPVWGISLAADDPGAADPFRWRGLNLLGFALMETRDLLGMG